MIIKQPSLRAVVLIASCTFFADSVVAGSVSSPADLRCIEIEELRSGNIPQADPNPRILNIHDGTGIKPLAPVSSQYRSGLRTVMNMKDEFNWEII